MAILDGQYVDIPIFNQLVPNEGPKAIRARFDFTTIDIWTVDLTYQMQAGIIKAVQTLFIDNAENPNDLVITTTLSNQRIMFPRFHQGYIPVLLPTPAIFNVACTGGKADIHMLNVPMPIALWSLAP